jgi:hypothetical protein
LYDEARWVNIATAILQGEFLPPVDLIRVGETYFVRDGHHRISAARALGQKEIDAVVTTWNVNEQNLFMQQPEAHEIRHKTPCRSSCTILLLSS